jgi:hypothetical protein
MKKCNIMQLFNYSLYKYIFMLNKIFGTSVCIILININHNENFM